MLTSLNIRDIVLIEKLDLEIGAGLNILTGETGAGKSILLDSLGLALGARGDACLVRAGADKGMVTASFQLSDKALVEALLADAGIELEDELILRRVQMANGTSRALINDQPVSVALLKAVGSRLCEIHGQHEARALVDVTGHRRLLDAFGGLESQRAEVEACHDAWRAARKELASHREQLEKAEIEQTFLVHAVEELKELAPVAGEEEELANTRQVMMHAEGFSRLVSAAIEALSGDGSLDGRLNSALRKMEMRRQEAGGRLDDACKALEQVVLEINEARVVLDGTLEQFVFQPSVLEDTEKRLFALRAMARKHKTTVDELPALLERYQESLMAIENGAEKLSELESREAEARKAYLDKARALSAERVKAAKALDAQVMQELPPLRLEKARFETFVEPVEDKPMAHGLDRVEFMVAANPGLPVAPMVKSASGGELSRFMLALKVVLAGCISAPTLIFDEIDTGVGGAVADAIGKRLSRLSQDLQVLAITHSPQVASRADEHLLISKIAEVGGDAERAVTRVAMLGPDARREEIARMLSGADITDEARAQADRLLAGQK